MRRSTTESEEEKQGPAAGYTWILNDTTERNTYLGIEEEGAGRGGGVGSCISGYVMHRAGF